MKAKSEQKFNRNSLNIEDNWSAKEIGYQDSELISFYRKNLGASEIAGHPQLSNLVYLTILYTPNDQRGFPEEIDYKLLSDFEDIDVPQIEIESNSIHIASVLTDGVKDLLFYVSDPDSFVASLNKSNGKIANFKVELELVSDPNWEAYHDFP